MDMQALGKRLRVYRAAHSISQTEMAQQLGISQSALSLIETNKPVKQLDDAKLAQIFKACGKVSA